MLKGLLIALGILVTTNSFSQTTRTQLNPRTFIPPQAFEFKPIINNELTRLFPTIPTYNYIPALIEHESCITLTHRRCWNSTSELRSNREQGLGLGQTTRTFRPDGSIRFDTLTEMRNRHLNELREASWDTFKNRPDLQIRMIILHIRGDYNQLHNVSNPVYRLHMTNAAYNGGLGGLQRERRACGLAKGCDPGIWFNHVERYCLKSQKALYGTRSACDINRTHSQSVFKLRLPKYEQSYFKN